MGTFGLAVRLRDEQKDADCVAAHGTHCACVDIGLIEFCEARECLSDHLVTEPRGVQIIQGSSNSCEAAWKPRLVRPCWGPSVLVWDKFRSRGNGGGSTGILGDRTRTPSIQVHMYLVSSYVVTQVVREKRKGHPLQVPLTRRPG